MPRAGLDPATVTETGADLADEIGFAQLSMSVVAERLGVKTPSLYKHVDGLADLSHRIAILAATEVGEALGTAVDGATGREALDGAARALRAYVVQHPGRYAATVSARPTGPDDALIPARDRVLTALSGALADYDLDPADEIHALRMLRSVLHGFATLEAADSFQMNTDIDESFTWVITFLDQGLRGRGSARPV
ncbi:TetR-like C-terminal domain-containing protein [Microbacterium sp. NPDC089189]|uniref:TetR/AcrR family transcriptional regulator n=1 Tax=Microbacterium sp. NPDC089189 TaxID=3154972 RepID=UPI003433BD80